MSYLFMGIVSVIIIWYFVISEADEVKLRVSMLVAMIGIDYTPSNKVCAVISLAAFYLLFGVIIER